MKRFLSISLWATSVFILLIAAAARTAVAADKRPNILFAISDDQSYPHASAYGCQFVKTPAFDRVAKQGVLFRNAFAASPGCSPSRASILTGRFPWQNEHAGTHASMFSNQYATYPQLLQNAGYHVGSTGKGWGPGNFKDGGFSENPAGKPYNVRSASVPAGIRNTDYAASFEQFLNDRDEGEPFCFWYGASEPHRKFGKGLGEKNGGEPASVHVPSFLPDVPEIRSDLLDYAFEIEWFDQHLGRMLDTLAEMGELENTIVVVTSDNGMAFPRAKANLYDHGFHVPLAISWPAKFKAGKTVDDVVSLIDLMPTYLQAAKVEHPGAFPMAGRSLWGSLTSESNGRFADQNRTHTFSARERHSSSRWNNFAYPQRCIRTDQFLYVRNFRPDRWPAGAPQKLGKGNYPSDTSQLGPEHEGYHDIDACPTFDWMLKHKDDPKHAGLFALSVDRRPTEELFDIKADPGCLKNLANDYRLAHVKYRLSNQLMQKLKETKDPRAIDGGDIFETYKRYSRKRKFPEPVFSVPAATNGFQPIFNGKDFSGWSIAPKDSADDWSVKNGVIVGAGSADRLSYLIFDKPMENLELKLNYRMVTKGNTGVEVRARVDTTGKRPFEGYHADLGHADIGPGVHGAWDFHFAKRKEYPCPRGTQLVIHADGSFDQQKLPNAMTPDDINRFGWNELHIIANGTNLQFLVNNRIAAEFTDNHEEILKAGLIGLQIHDKGMVVQFKDVMLKSL